MYPQKTTSKSIIRWCKAVHLIVIDLVDSGACSGRKILTSLVYERYNVSTGLAAVCGNFVASHVQIQRGIGGPHQTKLCGRLRSAWCSRVLLHYAVCRSFK